MIEEFSKLKKANLLHFAVTASAIAAGATLYPVLRSPIHAASRGMAQQASAPADPGAAAYAAHCAICHGDHREGNPPAFPSLMGIGHQMSETQIADMIHKGKERMPSFPDIKDPELGALLHFLTAPEPAPAAAANGLAHAESLAGSAIFRQNCSFCHGRDAQGGETGPDLTQSKLVLSDKTGDTISTVITEGRPPKMPPFKFSDSELHSLVAFIHERAKMVAEHPGGRRGVEVADLQTGNAEAGKAYFNGAGGCAKCHSPTGDLAGIASRFEGLRLEERMLYPWNAKRSVTVTLASGQQITGTLAFEDEFAVALREADGTYRSWFKNKVQTKVDAPVDAHIEQFPKYTDDDIHNLMAYLQTLR